MATIEEIAHQIIEQQMGEVCLVYSSFIDSPNLITPNVYARFWSVEIIDTLYFKVALIW